MSWLVFENGELLDPEARAPVTGRRLLVEGERIRAQLATEDAAPEDARRVDLAGRWLAPGFLDVHFHGRGVFAPIASTAEALRHDAASCLRHGCTAFLPTTLAWAQRELKDRVAFLADAIADAKEGATPLGIHLEGPWISRDAAGAQPLDPIRPYAQNEGSELLERADGLVRMVTFAPEIPGAAPLVDELVRREIVAAIGHTRADAATASAAVDRGTRHVTHLYNAMGALHHREPGTVGVALADERLTCDLICDGVHVDALAVQLAARAKGERLILITDRLDPPEHGGSMGEGALREDGDAWRLPDGRLAGSCVTLERAVANAQSLARLERVEAIAAASLRPARLLGVEAERGTLRPGARADLVILEADGSVAETWLGGRRVFESGPRDH